MSLLAAAGWHYSSILGVVVPPFKGACELRMNGWFDANIHGASKGHFFFLNKVSILITGPIKEHFAWWSRVTKDVGVWESAIDLTETDPTDR